MPPAGNWLCFACSIPPLFVLSHSLPMVNTMGKLASFWRFFITVVSASSISPATGHCSRGTDHHSPHATSSRFTGHCSPAVRQPSGVGSCADPSPLATAIHRPPDWQRPNGARSRLCGLSLQVCHRTRRFLRKNQTVLSPLAAAQPLTVLSWPEALNASGSRQCLPDGHTAAMPVLQPIMPLDLPVKVRSWELTVYPRSYIRRRSRVTWVGVSSNVNVLERRASQLAGRNMSAK